jgi:subtilisin family serine protease
MSKFTKISVFVLVAALAIPAFADKPDFAAGRYYVVYKQKADKADKDLLKANGAKVKDEFDELNAIEVESDNPAAMDAISKHSKVDYVEQVPMRYAMDLGSAQAVPSLGNGLYGLLTTKATTAHGRGWTGSGIVVGVADTQLDIAHPDIAANLNASTNCVQTNPCSGSGWQNDGETHATHVSGTILGVNNSQGVYGVAYGAKLVHARVLAPGGGSTSDIMRGVTWLKDHGAKIVNLSLGGGRKSKTEENFYKSIRNTYGVIVVAATGNDGTTTVSCPACYPINVAVGAVDVNDVVASFSNKGTNIDVTAPGVLVLSSVPNGTGHEASVTAGSEYRAFGMEFAGATNGITGNLYNCGIGNPGQCPAGVAGNIALIQRGTLDFATKVTNAKNQGAVAAIIYNNAAGDFTGTLGAAGSWIPAVSVSDVTGTALLSQSSGTVVNKVSNWDHYDGTSMATPHTAGVFALVWAANPTMTANAIETVIKNNCDDKGAAGYDTTYGYGRVNADKALIATGK